MQGAAGQGKALTAFVVIVLLKYGNVGLYAVNINKALTYLKNSVDASSSVYELAITTYALGLANDPSKNVYLGWFKAKAISAGGLTHWENASPASPVAVEITAYGLLIYIDFNQPEGELQAIAKWLIGKRNSLGGYESTQDTVVTLQALTALAKLLYSAIINMDINIQSSFNPPINWHIDQTNALVLQKQDLDPRTRSVNVLAVGAGIALCQLSCQYNVPADPKPVSFEVLVAILLSKHPNSLLLEICVRYLAGRVSNMVVVEIYFPSGYIFDRSTKPEAPGLKVTISASEVLKDFFNLFVLISHRNLRSKTVAQS